jgi:tetratricopeptide (TPR) repeat protein
MQLDDAVYEHVTSLSARGNQLFDAGLYEAARQEFEEAWKLLPEPINQWEAATWLLASIGDCWFELNDYQQAHECFRKLLRDEFPDAMGNVFIHLRRGQTALEVGNTAMAAEDLLTAYALGGCEAFDQDDPKYFAWLQANVAPPPSGWLSNIG